MTFRLLAVPFLIFVLLAESCTTVKTPLVIGHRGAMGHVTENTLASVQKALDLGVDAIEIDVFKIKGGKIVVFHDQTLERLSDASGPIEDYSWAALEQVELKGGHKIPVLEEVLDLTDRKVRLNIELKGAGTAADVDRIIQRYIGEKGWAMDDFIVSSFKWDELTALRQRNPQVPIAVLTGGDPKAAIPTARELNAEAINPNFKQLTQENTNAMHEAGLKVYVWTVNEPEDILQMKQYGVDGIITDFPERAH